MLNLILAAVIHASSPQIQCQTAFNTQYNSSQEPVWAQSEYTTNTCGDRERGAILVCVRTVCNTSGLFFGGWVHNLGIWSRATSGIINARLSKAWIEDQEQTGAYVCKRFVPTVIQWFPCNPNNP